MLLERVENWQHFQLCLSSSSKNCCFFFLLLYAILKMVVRSRMRWPLKSYLQITSDTNIIAMVKWRAPSLKTDPFLRNLFSCIGSPFRHIVFCRNCFARVTSALNNGGHSSSWTKVFASIKTCENGKRCSSLWYIVGFFVEWFDVWFRLIYVLFMIGDNLNMHYTK